MMDRRGIYTRFIDCFPVNTAAALAKTLGLDNSAVLQWKALKRQIPWKWLKAVADKYGISWDWLLDGKEPKISPHRAGKRPKPLNRHAINKRFISLFPNMSQAEIAEELGVTQTSVYRWCNDIAQVSRKSMKYAVDNKGVTWEWLLEGRK